MKRIWILDEGSQGHLVQSRGMVRELSKQIDVEVIEIPARLTISGGFTKSVTKRLLRRWRWKWLFDATHSVGILPTEAPDLIVASGPRAMTALEYLSEFLGCPSVLVQGTLAVPEGVFTAVMRPFEGEYRDDFIFIPLLFTEITHALVDAAKQAFLAENQICPKGPVNTLFVGASSAKIRFSPDDWKDIIGFVNDLWKRDRHQWLITTSYRTGRELEELFIKGINPDAILDAVWYSQSPRKVAKAYLGLASRVFVTMDSLTMLSEAVCSGRPTYALITAGADHIPSNTHQRYVRELSDQGLIARMHATTGATCPPLSSMPAETDYTTPIRKLLAKLQWKT
jgi:mitochondrial fission protein ELM1